MIRILTVVLLLCFALPRIAPAAGDEMIRVASGRKGFTYRSVYARNLEKLMRGYKIIYLPSEGSGQNLDLLADGKANVAFAQADNYAERLTRDPNRYGKLIVIGRLAPECVYIAHRKDGPVRTLGELVSKATTSKATVAVGDSSSGMNSTWSYMSKLVDGLSAVRVDHTKGTLALNQLAVGAFDAVAWVTDPSNREQKMLRALLANDALALMPLEDPALISTLPDGVQIYRRRTVKLGDGLRAAKLETICTSAMVFTRSDAGERLIDKLSDVLSLQLDEIVPHGH